MASRKPTRPSSEISQNYNSGLLTVYSTKDIAPVGRMPKLKLTPRGQLRYEELRLGLKRLYLARQDQVEISRVVRVMRRPEVSPQDVVITEDGRVYRIDAVQMTVDVYPPSMDLSLIHITEDYEVLHDGLDETHNRLP